MEESSTSVALEKGISVTQTQKAVSFAVKSKTCRVVPVRAAGGGGGNPSSNRNPTQAEIFL